jgi:hypothetical protein
MRGTWQTTDDGGGSGLGVVALVILAAAVLGPAVAAAVAELLHLLVMVIVVLAAVAGAGLVALGAWRLRHSGPNRVTAVSFPRPLPQRPAESLTAPQRPAIERPAEVHLHFHGVSAEEVAAVLHQPQMYGPDDEPLVPPDR